MTSEHRPARAARLGLTGWLAPAVLALGLAACGGGTTQYENYEPGQYVAIGDESSVILADGRRYTVNPLDTAGALQCGVEPLWVQTIAAHYGFVFQQCNTTSATEFKAKMRATSGAKVADIETQISAQVADGGFPNKTLVTVMLGVNDVLELYASYPTQSEAQIIDELRLRGERLGQQVNRIVDLGGRVVVATVHDIGLSPFGQQEKAAHTDTDRAALLTRLITAFNSRLRTTIINDGRYIGLVLGDEVTQSLNKWPEVYGLSNGSTAVCTVATPGCTSATLVTSGASASWLWADDRWMAYGGQYRLGTIALSRATGNPF